MNALGTHLLLELRQCDKDLLDDMNHIKEVMLGAAVEAGATIVGQSFHKFDPRGVTGIIAIAESHLCIHTWPEYGYAAADFYTCGDCKPIEAHRHLMQQLGAEGAEIMTLARGRRGPGPLIQLMSHDPNRTK